MTSPKYCLPIKSGDIAAVRATIGGHEPDYSFFEVWLEYVAYTSIDELVALAMDFPGKILWVFRRLLLEDALCTPGKLESIVQKLSDVPCLMDLDIKQHVREIEILKSTAATRCIKVISFHDYDSTPADAALRKIVEEMDDNGADIVKVACMCRTETDGLRLMSLCLELKASGKRFIVLGMGSHGIAARIMCSWWGNEMVFAPAADTEQTAPGQLSRSVLERIFQGLESAYAS